MSSSPNPSNYITRWVSKSEPNTTGHGRLSAIPTLGTNIWPDVGLLPMNITYWYSFLRENVWVLPVSTKACPKLITLSELEHKSYNSFRAGWFRAAVWLSLLGPPSVFAMLMRASWCLFQSSSPVYVHGRFLLRAAANKSAREEAAFGSCSVNFRSHHPPILLQNQTFTDLLDRLYLVIDPLCVKRTFMCILSDTHIREHFWPDNEHNT